MSESRTHPGIVVGVDGSQASKLAVRWAARDAELRNVPLTLVHALAASAGTWLGEPSTLRLTSRLRQRGQQEIDEALELVDDSCRCQSPHTSCEMPSADAVSALTVLSGVATLVVVGRRGNSTTGGPPVGSVSSALIHRSRCPVAVIHEQDSSREQPEQAPVLVGIDGSPSADLATAIAFDEAARRKVELVALHAWRDISPFDASGWAKSRPDWPVLRAVEDEVLAERLAGWGERYPEVPVRRVIVRDKPARQLIDQSQWAQLVVVGSHGAGGFAEILFGGVSAAVVQAVHAPVIVARPQHT